MYHSTKEMWDSPQLEGAPSLQAKLLSKSCFVQQLRREKRRADRFKAPLSIVLFRFANINSDEVRIWKFVESLSDISRQTDILGYLDEGAFGLLLPDTTKPGMHAFLKRTEKACPQCPMSIVTATYPDQLFDRISAADADDCFPIFLDHSSESLRCGYILKRGLDIIGSIAGILLLSPLMLITALAIRLTSPGPAIFKQVRLGIRGTPFSFYKFRSMYWNTDDQIHRQYVSKLIQGDDREEVNQGEKDKPLYKIRHDPRVTRIGRIIRKTSIDELPQLFNVLIGDMSLVGPRPPLPYEVEKYQPWHLRRTTEMKPGITGLWQVEGRSRTSFDDMVRLDLQYIQNWSLMLDVKILIKTVKVVLRSTGAF